jgi:peptidoglycan/LPS O-acetylase OafA/YrhL
MSAFSHIRRDDLQCWRALSILAVLLFHIWPEQFPNGYLGVDIFFVLSGYLMASLYSFDSNIISSTIDFYYRRIKRILPIYLIVIFLTLLALSKQVFPEEYKLIVEDSKWAIALATNYEDLLKKRGYFETESNFRFFRHCWSLAVEMQFYLIFPFIAIARGYISTMKYQLLLILILTSSLLYQITSTNPITQYEGLFCRIWQFTFGMLAQTLPVLTIKWLPSILLLGASTAIFCSFLLPRLVVSFFTITMAAGIISMSTSQFHPFKSLLHKQKIINWLVILGDISYVIYLIHWPLITYSRVISTKSVFTYFDGFLLFMTSILLSQIVHVIIEKLILKICNGYRNLIICLVILYACSIYIPEQISLANDKVIVEKVKNQSPSMLTLDLWKQALDFNHAMIIPPNWTTKNDIEFAEKLRGEYMGGAVICKERKTIRLKKSSLMYCEVMGNPNGTLVGLSVGNSFSMNIVPAISSNPLFKRVINVFGNSAPFPAHNEFERYIVDKLIKTLKPDITFLVQRYYSKYYWNTPISKIKDHPEFKHWNAILKEIENYTSAIIINKEQIVFPYDISQEYIRRKFNNLPIESKLKNPVSVVRIIRDNINQFAILSCISNLGSLAYLIELLKMSIIWLSRSIL